MADLPKTIWYSAWWLGGIAYTLTGLVTHEVGPTITGLLLQGYAIWRRPNFSSDASTGEP